MKIEIVYRDITTFPSEVEAIVNAANETLLGGGGVDGAIHKAAGPELVEECRKLGGCLPGEAKITKAYRLPQRYIIHTVGPRYFEDPTPQETLASCYKNALSLAERYRCKRIAFPSIATGVFSYPVLEAALVCAKTIKEWNAKSLEVVYLAILEGEEETYEAYKKAFL